MPGGEERGKDHWRSSAFYEDADIAGDDQAGHHCCRVFVYVNV